MLRIIDNVDFLESVYELCESTIEIYQFYRTTSLYENSDHKHIKIPFEKIIDLSGIPFEVLSITVSLISRLLFEVGYYYTRVRQLENPTHNINNDTPFLLVYEEAHKYVPNSDLIKYRASRESIERIAKEGRKAQSRILCKVKITYKRKQKIYDETGRKLSVLSAL